MSMKLREWVLGTAAILSLAAWQPQADAQYMYLDLNGDGVHDVSDVLAPSGTQAVDVWLDTAHNRDGSSASCISGAELTSLDGFEVILHASGGTVTWSSGFFSPVPLRGQNDTDFHGGQESGGQAQVPGLFHLGTVNVTPQSGAPVLSIATTTPLSPRFATAFGSPCYGLDYDNWLKFGQDWLDADGTGPAPVASISGIVFHDANSTTPAGCGPEAGETGISGQAVTLSPGALQVTTGPGGVYRFFDLPDGSYTVSVTPPTNMAQTCPPANASHGVTLAGGTPVSDLDFGFKDLPLTPLGYPGPDLVARIISPGWGAPEAPSQLYVDCLNKGGGWAKNVNVNVTLPPEYGFVSSTSGSLSFPFGWIAPSGGSTPGQVDVVVAKSATLGSYVTATATPVPPDPDDINPSNDTGADHAKIGVPFDPNEKSVFPPGRILRPQTLTYHVGFQNTGTAPAINVVVKDVIDDRLDLATLVAGPGTHPYKLSIQGRELTWTFPNIQLPDSNANEPASHGFFNYTIRPLSTAPDGSALSNTASIYFDFNEPILTNAAVSTIDSPPLVNPIPDRTLVEGTTLDQPFSASDPEGDPLTFTKSSGPAFASVVTTGPGAGSLHLAPVSGDAGTYSIGVNAADGILEYSRTTTVNVLTVTGVGEVGSLPVQDLNLASAEPLQYFHLDGNTLPFSASQVMPGSIKLWHSSGGKLLSASSAPARSNPLPSADPGGREEPNSFCFATSDMRRLFAAIENGAQVTATCEGTLRNGTTFSAWVPVRIRTPQGAYSAGLSPNPVRQGSLLTFRTKLAGRVRVALFSANGRLVRTLYEDRQTPAGYHEVQIQPRTDGGVRLGAGIYFYRIEGVEGRQVGRVTILR